MQLPGRLVSIDVFRAITMLLMIFVNDVSGVHHIPAWIDHAAANEDRLGFADVIFPAFLFIVGLSLPIAIQQRSKKGDSTVPILWYIIGRSAALIIMGFYQVNLESYSSQAVLPRAVWAILVTLAFFFIWLDYPSHLQKAVKNTLKFIGILTLLVMALLYKGGDAENLHGMEASWWGILGIIGWAYLVCSVLFVLLYGKLSSLLIAWLLLLLINMATHAGFMPFHINIVGDASSASLIMTGAVVSSFYAKAAAGKKKKVWLTMLVAVVLLFACGFIIRPYAGGISKIYATPAWVFICAGISLLVFTFLTWLVDVKEKQNWFTIIRPAGTSTLTCYLLPYLLYSIFELAGFWYPHYFNSGMAGIIRSFVIAFFIVWVAGLLSRKRIRLKV